MRTSEGFRGKTALVTGAAGGMGLEVCHWLDYLVNAAMIAARVAVPHMRRGDGARLVDVVLPWR